MNLNNKTNIILYVPTLAHTSRDVFEKKIAQKTHEDVCIFGVDVGNPSAVALG